MIARTYGLEQNDPPGFELISPGAVEGLISRYVSLGFRARQRAHLEMGDVGEDDHFAVVPEGHRRGQLIPPSRQGQQWLHGAIDTARLPVGTTANPDHLIGPDDRRLGLLLGDT